MGAVCFVSVTVAVAECSVMMVVVCFECAGYSVDFYHCYKFIIIYIVHPCCKMLDALNNTLCTELIVYKFTFINQILIE